jgi:hypothetical protein
VHVAQDLNSPYADIRIPIFQERDQTWDRSFELARTHLLQQPGSLETEGLLGGLEQIHQSRQGGFCLTPVGQLLGRLKASAGVLVFQLIQEGRWGFSDLTAPANGLFIAPRRWPGYRQRKNDTEKLLLAHGNTPMRMQEFLKKE